MSYIIYTDTGCDIKPDMLESWGVKALSLTFRFTDEEKEYTEADMPIAQFYAEMRKGRVAKTAAVNAEEFRVAFEGELKEGRDVLYIGFSSGLSSTYNAGRMAAEMLAKDYPERRVLTVDSLCASAGQGLLVYLAVMKQREGIDLDGVYEYTKASLPKVAHWFTVEDLVYLKRGGRVSATAAFVGNLLGIKPVLHVDEAGKLVPVRKVRGRRASLLALAEEYKRTAINPAEGVVFISSADCYEEANFLADKIKECGPTVEVITDVGAVIGSHSGPGTMALFFLAKER